MFLSLSLAALAWLVIVLIVRDWQRARRLPALQHSPVLASRPFVSIVIPARNEAANIARCLDGALSQRYAPYEVIVVDDGSTDATPRILHDYATRFSDKLTVVTGRPLPRGWVGKCNACLHGAQHARGDWLLFLDADTAPQPNLIAALLALAQQRGLDLVSVLPFNELRTWSEQLVLPVFYQFALTAFPLQRNLSADPPASNVLANGQCLLVRADAYWSLGGHEVVKDKVLRTLSSPRRCAEPAIASAWLQRSITFACGCITTLLKSSKAWANTQRPGGGPAAGARFGRCCACRSPCWPPGC